MNDVYSRIIGTGGYLPAKVLVNRDLESMVDTTDEWIYTRTGIRQRHIAADHEKTSDLALEASRRALQAAAITAADLDLIVVATTTPDMVFPGTACILQAKLGKRNCPAFDVQAVCSGFIYGLATADQFMRSGNFRHVLVVGSEVYSRILDWSDRATCVLFGDGAGAVVLGPAEVGQASSASAPSTASLSTIPSREKLSRIAPFFMSLMRAAFTIPRVTSSSGTCNVTKSDAFSTSSMLCAFLTCDGRLHAASTVISGS